jgi:HAD superfamily hydrolase (TIGR01549 family)
MIKAVIFDFDGLLIDSEPAWFKARKSLLNEFNMDWTLNDQKHTLGVSTKDWVNYLHNKLQERLTPDEILDKVISKMKEMYKKNEVMSKPGAGEALKYCKENNFIMGLASGSYKELLFIALKSKKWEKYFDEILSSDDLKKGKPAPDIYIEILKRLKVKPEESIVLEDSKDGIKAGVAAETNVIAVPGKEYPVPEDVLRSAIKVIGSLVELPETIRWLKGREE